MGGKLVQEVIAFLSTGAPFAIESIGGLFAAPVIALLVCAIFVVTIGYCFKPLEKNRVIFSAGLLFSLGAGWLVVYEFCRCVPHPRELLLELTKTGNACAAGLHFDETAKNCVSHPTAPSQSASDLATTAPASATRIACPGSSHYDIITKRCVFDSPSTLSGFGKKASTTDDWDGARQNVQNIDDGSTLWTRLWAQANCEPGKRFSFGQRRCVSYELFSPSSEREPPPPDSSNKTVETPSARILRSMTASDILSNAACGPNQHRDTTTLLCVGNDAPAPPPPMASGRARSADSP